MLVLMIPVHFILEKNKNYLWVRQDYENTPLKRTDDGYVPISNDDIVIPRGRDYSNGSSTGSNYRYYYWFDIDYDVLEENDSFIDPEGVLTMEIDEVGITDGLVAWWPLNGDTYDYSGNGYHGESLNVNGTSPYPTGDGYIFECISDSSGGYIRTGLTPQYNAITFTCWIKPETIHSSELASCGDNDLNLTLTNNRPGIYISGMYPTTHLISSTTLPTDQWCFLAFTIENLKETSLGKIYINGSLDSQSNSLSRINGREYINPIGIGTDWDNYTPTGFYNGYIKDFRVYNRILSDEEIKILYEVTNFDSGLKAKITEDGRLYIKGINTCL